MSLNLEAILELLKQHVSPAAQRVPKGWEIIAREAHRQGVIDGRAIQMEKSGGPYLAAGASEGQADHPLDIRAYIVTDRSSGAKALKWAAELGNRFPSELYQLIPLTHHADAVAELTALRERIAGMEKDAERMKDLFKTLANIMQDQTVAMQSALIEWEFGKGAEAGFGWIVNTLEGPGNLPDPDAEHGKNAQFWFSANCAEPMPKCFCGNPSNTLWMGQGFCCREHYNEAKTKYDAARAMEKQG